jgi:hypothetical protein
MDAAGVNKDKRGKNSKWIKYTEEDEKRIIEIRKELVDGPSYFWGLDTVLENYKSRYGE